MNTNRKVILLSVAAIFLMACACPLTGLIDRFTSPENIAESIIDAIPEDLADQLPEDMDEFMEELPEMDMEDLEDMENMLNQPIPDNIPILSEREEDLYSMEGAITYSTKLPKAEVEEFYTTEMEKLGWTKADSGLLAGFAMEFENETQTAQVILNAMESNTYITIVILDK